MMASSIAKVSFCLLVSASFDFPEFCSLLCTGGTGEAEKKKRTKDRKRRIKEETKEDSGSSRNGSFSQG